MICPERSSSTHNHLCRSQGEYESGPGCWLERVVRRPLFGSTIFQVVLGNSSPWSRSYLLCFQQSQWRSPKQVTAGGLSHLPFLWLNTLVQLVSEIGIDEFKRLMASHLENSRFGPSYSPLVACYSLTEHHLPCPQVINFVGPSVVWVGRSNSRLTSLWAMDFKSCLVIF